MRKSLAILVLFLVVLNLISCKKGDIKNLTSINYSTSFGMCVGYCSSNLLISDLKLTFSKSKNGQVADTKTCTKTIAAEEVNAIKNELNKTKLSDLPEVIGCPDCADGGAESIAVSADGKQYKITFEYGKAPKELEEAIKKLRALKDSFKDCN